MSPEATTKNTVIPKEEVIAASTGYFNGNQFSAEIWTNKYAMRNTKNEFVERVPDDMHRRIVSEYARIEAKYPNPMSFDEIMGLIGGFRYFIPAGSPMFGIGNPYQLVSQSNCYVISTLDSYGGICRADERLAQIAKRRGGVGIDISPIRPKGLPTKNAAHTTDGIVVFMERFSRTCREVAQSGRRGALMLTISVHHPEIQNFIAAKSDLQKVTGANISIRVSDEFMQAVKSGGQYEMRWPVDSKEPKMRAMVDAKPIWDEIISHAHKNAEPGVLFWDTIIRNSPADCYADLGFKTESTNPCGELPLCDLDSCRLSAINLTAYVSNPYAQDAAFDFKLFKNHAKMAQRLMDDLIDIEIESVDKIVKKVEADPEPESVKANEIAMWKEIKRKCADGRRTGLGVTGLGDCLAMLGVVYGSDESLDWIEKIYKGLRDASYESSVTLAEERGAFPIFDKDREVDHQFLTSLPKSIKDRMQVSGRRNIACLTTAPVGTTSNIVRLGNSDYFGVTSGFEPVFLTSYTRRKKMSSDDHEDADFTDELGDRWKEFEIVHPGVVLCKDLTQKEFDQSPYAGAEAGSIDFIRRVEMQAMATKFVDHSISSTVNLPEETTEETVASLYMRAWEAGCKGVTVYRQGSRAGVLIKKGARECDECDDAAQKLVKLTSMGCRPSRIVTSAAPRRLNVMECDIQRSKVGGGDWVFLVGKLNGHPYEIFGGESKDIEIPRKFRSGWICKDGKEEGRSLYDLVLGDLENPDERMIVHNVARQFKNFHHASFGRLVSTSLRHGVPIKVLCEQITKDPEDDLHSFSRAVSRILKKYIADGERSGLECAQCHSGEMVYRNGCPTCMICGMSACS